MRITLVISSLSGGGAERVMTLMANYWLDKGNEVTLITLAPVDSDFFDVSSGVRRVGLGLVKRSKGVIQGALNNLRRLWKLRREIQSSRPDVVISFVDQMNILTLLSTRGLPCPVIVSERTAASFRPIGKIWDELRKRVYVLADAIVVQTEGVRKPFEKMFSASRLWVVPNPVVEAPRGTHEPTVLGGSDYILGLGRLSQEKGFDLLLRSFAKVSSKFPAWNLVIIGDGPEKENLFQLCDELGLMNRVSFLGRLKDPAPILRGASIFALTSRYEGFPNALLEAMAAGVPSISFDCPCGPSEIIRNGVDGILVRPGDLDEFSAKLEILMRSQAERVRLGSKGPEVLQRFALPKVMEMWSTIVKTARVS